MITSLAYLGVNSPRSEDWRRFGAGFLGAELAEDGPDGSVRLRVDDAAWRIQIHPAEEDSVAYFGWAVDHEEDLDVVVERLAEAGVTAERGSAELADVRAVNRLITFTDPWGFPHEVSWGQHFHPSTFRPGRAISGFVTGTQGLGHVLLMMPDIEAGHRFFHDVLGFRLSDKIIVPGQLNARFYHVNERHHTLALGQCPPGVAVFNHLMLQMKSIDDVGSAYDMLDEYDVPITLSLGRHTNDKTFSFYCATPSLFNVEVGYDGIAVDGDWVPYTYGATAIWGHKLDPEAKNRPPGIVHPYTD
ncbi:VOC family protein [Nocardioides sp. T2.26MG-1]|uniref:VOC family protein n=1 Tax=Nocardioides sp. T2.26MG-1 TaxID=3041166 RepID=UPI002477B58C|nr:VOC family protein [Nocardioides sp. T2.26MG-1]CAI9410089.1 Biphenyl-2,3-diol 1,2-dioxygenase [Nocardioides sp. T2.26MG-1]